MNIFKKMNSFRGMTGYSILWGGQLISLMGSSMASFGIMIWIWQSTGSATPFAIYGFCSTIPRIFASPIVGVFVDRWNRKTTMAITDFIIAISSTLILVLYYLGSLQYWHLYIIAVFVGFFESFQHPAFSSAVALILPKKHYSRANGMRSMVTTSSRIIAPILAGGLLNIIGLQGILLIDIITALIAIAFLLFVYIPHPPVTQKYKSKSLWKDSLIGFQYICQRKSLLLILMVYLVMNMSLAFSRVLRVPLILARSNNELILASVQSISVVGGLLGSSLLTIFGGPKKKINSIFLSMSIMGLTTFLMGIGKGLMIWASIGIIKTFFMVLANVSSRAFWQSKVEPEIQGRVFATTKMFSEIAKPVSMLIAGPLVDNVLEPGMTSSGLLAKTFGWLVGTDTGSGIALMFILVGTVSFLTALAGYMIKDIRDAEDIIPDHNVAVS